MKRTIEEVGGGKGERWGGDWGGEGGGEKQNRIINNSPASYRKASPLS